MIPDKLHIFKLTAAGNDFVVIDARQGPTLDHEQAGAIAKRLCRRRVDVGADGFMTLGPPRRPGDAFAMTYYNADGSHAETCGNGARAMATFARHLGIFDTDVNFETDAGPYRARYDGERMHVQMADGTFLKHGLALDDPDVARVDYFKNGVPHAVIWLQSPAVLAEFDVDAVGRRLRYHEAFAPAGTNANFAASGAGASSPDVLGRIMVRTYERGVEGETLACGTGCVSVAASFLASSGVDQGQVELQVASGDVLLASLRLDGDRLTDVTLAGPARVVFEGDVRLG